jgi:Tol biopolymer transport system component
LYFSSNRGGTMNLWRVAIDEASGRTSGRPEPITTPSLWSGGFSFSRDGKRLVFGSLDWRSALMRAEFDPATGALEGAGTPILKGSEPIRDHELSPDGQWVAFMRFGSQDDILVSRTDGSQSRRLTDDSFRDRGPAWSPDGTRIAFYSDRSGSYQIWLIRPDGSGLQQVTEIASGTANFPLWSPDGSRLAISVIPHGPALIDMSAGKFPAQLEPLPQVAADRVFWPLSWSANGKRLAGITVLRSGLLGEMAVLDLERGTYELVPGDYGRAWRIPAWLADNRRLIARDSRGVWLIDPEDAASDRKLVDVGGYAIGKSVGISRDNRWITWTETGAEGDIWLAEFETGSARAERP